MKQGWEARGGKQEWELTPVAKKIHLPATERDWCIGEIHWTAVKEVNTQLSCVEPGTVTKQRPLQRIGNAVVVRFPGGRTISKKVCQPLAMVIDCITSCLSNSVGD